MFGGNVMNEQRSTIDVSQVEVQEILKKYDPESRFRILQGFPRLLMKVWLIAMSVFHLYTAGGGFVQSGVLRGIHLSFALPAIFILFPAVPNKKNHNYVAWYDCIFALASLISAGYIALFYTEITMRGAAVLPHDLWLGYILIALITLGGMRVIGKILPFIGLFFLLYCRYGFYAPGIFQIRGYSWTRIIQHMYLTPEGIFGVAIGASSTFVIIFILFGAFLNSSGGGRFFSELSVALAGGAPGGPAKVAVIASALLGTINGSSIASVATTGPFTIPMMKRVGYSPAFAGAVEAAASTGGQLLPPIMGAGAFLMAEFLAIPYVDIIIAATFPAIIYYFAIFATVHFRACKDGMQGLPKSELPDIRAVLRKDGHLLIPIAIIVAALLMKYSPVKAGFFGNVSIFVICQLRKHTRLGIRAILGALEEGARGSLGVAAACAIVGLIVGTTSLTSIGMTLSNNIMDISGGKLLPTLIMTMVACLVIGMGLPTTANYIVCSTVVAPVLIGMKVMPIAAHLFVFYYGIMADITPPVCLAAFTGAGIAGANPLKTGVLATRIALASFILPFSFVYGPEVLLHGASFLPLVITLIACTMGVVALSAAIEGWLYRPLGIIERIIVGGLAIAAFVPHRELKVVAIIAFVCVALYIRFSRGTVQPVGQN